MRKSDVLTSYHMGTQGLPMLNVKAHDFFYAARSFEQGCIEERIPDAQIEEALHIAWDLLSLEFWDNAEELAQSFFECPVEVYSAGRQSGWLVVKGLRPVEDWDAIMVTKWAAFKRMIDAEVDSLCSASSIREIVHLNKVFGPEPPRETV